MNDEYMLDECRAFGVNIKVMVIMHSEHSLLNGLLVVSKCRDQTKNKKLMVNARCYKHCYKVKNKSKQ